MLVDRFNTPLARALGAALALAAAAACGDDEVRLADPDAAVPDAAPANLEITSGPTFTLAPNPRAPLSGLLEISTNLPTRISVDVTDPNRSWTIEVDELAADHELTILGFRLDTTHTLTVTATAEDERTVSAAPFDVITGQEPDLFPIIDILVVDSTDMEPGVTMMGISDFVLMLDDEGEVVWIYENEMRPPQDVRRLANGHILFNRRDRLGAYEVDMLGRVIDEWHPANTTGGAPGSTPIAIDSIHHEILQLEDGTYLTLSTEQRAFDGYPTSETDPTPQSEPQNVIGDVVVNFAPNGTVLNQWHVLDILDPYRVAYDSFGDYWNPIYESVGGGIDWSHGNAAIPDPNDGGLIMSFRHQDAVVKIDADGELVWILGTHDNWDTAFQPYLLDQIGDPFPWPFHQHAPQLLPNGNIMIFDNGNHRVSPPDPLPDPSTRYSRAVEVRIDTLNMQVEQVWAYDADQTLFSAFLGDADALPVTGNVLITFGGGEHRLIEVTRDDPAQIVFDLRANVSMYRAERLPSLYPAATP